MYSCVFWSCGTITVVECQKQRLTSSPKPLATRVQLSTSDASRRCEDGVTESDEVARLLAMSDDQRVELGKAVLEAALHNENGLRAAMATGDDYGKSFSGTKCDTQASGVLWACLRGLFRWVKRKRVAFFC